jgi:hypothetical protein
MVQEGDYSVRNQFLITLENIFHIFRLSLASTEKIWCI